MNVQHKDYILTIDAQISHEHSNGEKAFTFSSLFVYSLKCQSQDTFIRPSKFLDIAVEPGCRF